MRKLYITAGLCLSLFLGSTALQAQDLNAFEQQVTEHYPFQRYEIHYC